MPAIVQWGDDSRTCLCYTFTHVSPNVVDRVLIVGTRQEAECAFEVNAQRLLDEIAV